MIEVEEQRTWRSPETIRRIKLSVLWIGGILLLPIIFTFTSDEPILWPNWLHYFWVFGLPYAIAVLCWVYPGKITHR